MVTETNVVAQKLRPAAELTTEQKLALMARYEDALCRIADAPEAKLSFSDLRRIAAEALGIK